MALTRGSDSPAVLEGSAPGLQAAGEPSDFDGTVTNVDRDKPPTYVHRVLCTSTGAIGQLISRFEADFVESGVTALAEYSTHASFNGDVPRTTKSSGHRSALSFTPIRPNLEASARQRDREIFDVLVNYHRDAADLIAATPRV